MTTPLFYHPTNVLCVDDDKKFLNFTGMEIGNIFPFVTESDPFKALSYLQSHCYSAEKLSKNIANKNVQSFSLAHFNSTVETYDINLNLLRGDLSSPERFKNIAVVLIDRHMPAMDGLEFCRIVREDYKLPVKLILLTGATTLDQAMQAFNEGKIDAYIEKKASEKISAELKRYLVNFVWQQFQELNKITIGFISHQIDHLNDSKFCEEFERIRDENKIVEFYLIDFHGSFLMIDADGKAKIFFVREDQDFGDMYDLAKDSGAFKNVLQNLRDRQQFPYTISGKGHLSLKGESWDDVMIAMDKIPGKEIFYSLISNVNLDVLSFNKYYGQIWPEH